MNGIRRQAVNNSTSNRNDNSEEELLRRIDHNILDHEERDFFDTIRRDIQGDEETQIISNSNAMMLVDRSARRRLARMAKPSGNLNAVLNAIADELPSQKIAFVRAKQLIPRSKKRKATKHDVRTLILQTFATEQARRLTTADMRGFQLTVRSASTNAWSVEVVGFPKSVEACLSLLRREVVQRRF